MCVACDQHDHYACQGCGCLCTDLWLREEEADARLEAALSQHLAHTDAPMLPPAADMG